MQYGVRNIVILDQNFDTAIYHPASNGQAERFVATFKQALRSMKSEDISSDAKVSRFQRTYRTTVNTSANEITSVLMTGRRLRTRLDLFRIKFENYKWKRKRLDRCFEIGQTEWIRDYRPYSSKWIPGIIEKRIGQLMYDVKVTLHNMPATWRRHADQLMSRESEAETLHHRENKSEEGLTGQQSSDTVTSENTSSPLIMRRSTVAIDGNINRPVAQNKNSMADLVLPATTSTRDNANR